MVIPASPPMAGALVTVADPGVAGVGGVTGTGDVRAEAVVGIVDSGIWVVVLNAGSETVGRAAASKQTQLTHTTAKVSNGDFILTLEKNPLTNIEVNITEKNTLRYLTTRLGTLNSCENDRT